MFETYVRMVLAATSALLLAAPARAQLPDLAEISAQTMPGVRVDDRSPVQAQLASYDVSFNLPIPLGKRTYLIPGAAHHVDSVSYSQVPAEYVQLRAFHSAELPVFVIQLLPKDWSLAFRVAPGLAGDFHEVDTRMLRVSGLVMATKPVTKQLLLGGGGLVAYSFGEWLPLPALYADFTPTRWLRFETFLPAFAQLSFRAGDRLEIGPRVDVSGNEYAIRDSRIQNGPECAGPAAKERCVDHIAYSVVKTGLRGSLRLVSSVWLSVEGGSSVYRRFEPMNEHGDPIAGEAHTLSNTWYAGGRLTWRIPAQ